MIIKFLQLLDLALPTQQHYIGPLILKGPIRKKYKKNQS